MTGRSNLVREDMMFATGWCGGMSAAGWLLMAGLWAVFLAVLVGAVLWLFPRGRGSGGPPPGAQDATGELDRQMAAGEIGADEYLRQRDARAKAR